MTIPEAGRQAAHVLLDAVSVFDEDADSSEVMGLALSRLSEIGAFTATFDDETDTLDLDGTGLIGGTLITIQYLVRQISLLAEAEQIEVISKTREFLDRNAQDDDTIRQ